MQIPDAGRDRPVHNDGEPLGILQIAGTVEAGKRADLIVLTADPGAATSNMRKIGLACVKGRQLTPGQLLDAR